LTLKKSNITQLKQLDGKKIGFYYGHISTDVIHSLLNKNNISRVEVDVGFDYSQLITGKIDAEWAFRTTAGLNLPAKGIEVNVISPADYGIRTQGYTIFTTEEMIAKHPDIVRRFLKATLEGVNYTLTNPDSALESIMKEDKTLNRSLERKRLSLYNEVTSNSKEYSIGYMDKQMFQDTYNRLRQEKVIANELDVSSAFDTRFLAEIQG
jgi:NitT/TauT family transport system substrate-binding protein